MILRQVSAAELKKSLTGAAFEHPGIEQIPQLAGVLNPGSAFFCFQFWKGKDLCGYAIIRKVRGILADLSFGPVLSDADDYPASIRLLKSALRKHLVLILRIVPPLDFPSVGGLPGKLNWATTVVNILRGEDALLQSFSPNHRQSIAKAKSAGVVIKPLGPEDAGSYTDGYLRMFSRRGFEKSAARELNTISGIIQFANDHPDEAFVLGAHHPQSGMLIGGGIFLRSGDTFHYYQGFSEKFKPALPVLHILLYSAMVQASLLGCTRFDLHGYSLSSDDAQLRAVNNFKRWFRGEPIAHPPTVIIPLYPMLGLLLQKFWRNKF